MRTEVFRRRMEALRRLNLPVVSLSKGLELLKSNAVDKGHVCITIDDGWKSTFTNAWPILRDHDFPACIYVTTYYSELEMPVFNVVILYMLWCTKREDVQLRGIHPDVDGNYDLRTEWRRVGSSWISAIELHFDHRERQSLLPVIAKALDLDIDKVLCGNRFELMDREEIVELSREPSIEIELHTHRHRLSRENEALVRQEIEENRHVLEAWTGKSCIHFCYPSGIYDEKHLAWLNGLGIASATTCDSGMNDASVPPLLLRRYLDRDDWSEVEFEAAVSGFLGILHPLRHVLTLTRRSSARPEGSRSAGDMTG